MPRNDSKDPKLTSLDQIVFVTGANGGIGASVMHVYAQSGATVIGADRAGRGSDATPAYYDSMSPTWLPSSSSGSVGLRRHHGGEDHFDSSYASNAKAPIGSR